MVDIEKQLVGKKWYDGIRAFYKFGGKILNDWFWESGKLFELVSLKFLKLGSIFFGDRRRELKIDDRWNEI